MNEMEEGAPAQASQGLTELIGHALTDQKFRKMLFEDRRKAIKGYHLSKGDLEALDKLSETDLEEHASQFGAEATALRIMIVIRKKF